jgi:hypothetical protein
MRVPSPLVATLVVAFVLTLVFGVLPGTVSDLTNFAPMAFGG